MSGTEAEIGSLGITNEAIEAVTKAEESFDEQQFYMHHDAILNMMHQEQPLIMGLIARFKPTGTPEEELQSLLVLGSSYTYQLIPADQRGLPLKEEQIEAALHTMIDSGSKVELATDILTDSPIYGTWINLHVFFL